MLGDLQELNQPELDVPYSSSEADPTSSEEEEELLDGSEFDGDSMEEDGQPSYGSGQIRPGTTSKL